MKHINFFDAERRRREVAKAGRERSEHLETATAFNSFSSRPAIRSSFIAVPTRYHRPESQSEWQEFVPDPSDKFTVNEGGNRAFISRPKRLFDIVVSFFNLLLLSPLMGVISLLIKIESPGPVFYVAKRVGAGGKTFDFLKFRSMRVGADSELDELNDKNNYAACGDGVFVKIQQDPRATRIGRFLRSTSLDELPQLINVLRGDMSIVGNRPLPLYEAKEVTQRGWQERFEASCGITGLWQTQADKDLMSSSRRIALDILYARNNSLTGDVLIMLRTLPAMLQRHGH